MGVFARIMAALAEEAQHIDMLMIDVAPEVRHWSENHWRGHLKARRTASSLRAKKGGVDA